MSGDVSNDEGSSLRPCRFGPRYWARKQMRHTHMYMRGCFYLVWVKETTKETSGVIDQPLGVGSARNPFEFI